MTAYQLALLHDGSAFVANFTAAGCLCTQQVPCREVHHTLVSFLDFRALCPLATAWATCNTRALYSDTCIVRCRELQASEAKAEKL